MSNKGAKVKIKYETTATIEEIENITFELLVIVPSATENKPKVIEEKSSYELDNEFYEKCFNTFDHKCEECGAKQPEEFLTSDGKVAARWRYSHIVPKSIAKELRRVRENINDLCLSCHAKWESEKKVEMKIYEKNSKIKILKKYFIIPW